MRRFLNNRISNYNNVGDKVDDFCEDCENRWLPFSRVWWDSTEKNIADIKRKDNGIFVIKKILSLINSISESIKDIYDRINAIEPPILSEKLIELENDYLEVGVTADDKQEDLNIAIYENYISLKNTKVDKPLIESTSDSLKIVALDNQGESVFIKSNELGKVKSVNNKIGEVILKTSDLKNDSDYTTNLKLNQERDERISGDNLKLDKPTTSGTTTTHPNIVGVDDLGNSAKLKATDFGKVKSVNRKEGDVILKTSDLENDSDYTTNATLTAHTSNKANPHNVTKSQVGLGNVDNTSDLNKSISTATQTELNKKINKPTTNNTPDYVLLADGSTAAKGDLGKNFANTDLVISENRKHTGTASVEFGMPMIYSNQSQRFPALADKKADATYNRVLVTNNIGQINYADLLTSEFIKFTENGKVGFALKYRKDNPTFYSAIGNNAVDLSIQTASSRGGASGNDSVAIGSMGKSTGVSSTSLGNSNTASGNNSLAAGTMNTANGSYSLALGYLNTASQGGDNAIGYKNIANGGYATAMGVMSEATGVQSVAMGTSSRAVGRYSTAIGYGVKSSTELSTAIGNVVESYSHNSIVMGSYNVVKTGQSQTGNPIVPTDDLFVIGNGFKNPTTGIATYSNALEIRNNGHTLLPSTTATMIEGNVKSVITKEYLDIRIPKPPTTGEYALKSINGVVSWVSI